MKKVFKIAVVAIRSIVSYKFISVKKINAIKKYGNLTWTNKTV